MLQRILIALHVLKRLHLLHIELHELLLLEILHLHFNSTVDQVVEDGWMVLLGHVH